MAGYREVLDNIGKACQLAGRKREAVQLVAVSKTYSEEDIMPLLEAGHRCFGENRVQESQQKWPALKQQFPDIELHLIGPLQSNKTADAVALFDVIHTVDRPKIAKALSKEMASQQKFPKLLVQVNTGEETQKAGILPGELPSFLDACQQDYGLSVEGLMCIPPVDEESALHFALLGKMAKRHGLPGLSMGMSSDYEKAVRLGSTFARVGTAIFGKRD